jgi:branched-chain amino acid aminotransferase
MLAAPRPGLKDVLAFYEHRVGAICRDATLMLCPLDDHIVHRGDGVFETMKYVGRKIYQLDAHLERMQRSVKSIFLEPPCSWDEVREIVLQTAEVGGRDDGLIRVLIGRGAGGFGIDPKECPVPSLYIAAYASHPKPESFWEQGVTAFRVSVPAKQDWFAQIKSVNYLPNVLMKREAAEQGADFPICFDEHNFLAEGATENIALVDQAGNLVIPEFKHALAGTTVLRGVDLIKDETPVRIKSVTEGEVYDAKELMVFGTTADCVGIVRFNGKPIHDARPGPVTKRLRELLQNDLLENGTAF